MNNGEGYENAVAIVAMAGRFPGAASVEKLWENVRNGVESVVDYTDEELLKAGTPKAALDYPRYVRAGAHLDDIEKFDAFFFGINAREAEMMDPQQRIFLEVVWEALERAGCDPETFGGPIGIFAGATASSYLRNNLLSDNTRIEAEAMFQALTANEKDSVAVRAAYKFNFKGASMTVQSYCSTSLVATHLACQSLLNYETDLALAGGVSIQIPQKKGYVYHDGGLYSSDGRCRTFDKKADGTIFGSGAAVIAFRRLEDAIRDGDHVYAVIRGSACNNDGAVKVGFTAPSVSGQAQVIADALANADVDPDSIRLIEAHGTATPLGDPIEVEGLTRAFRTGTDKKGFCAIGSIKTNVGHLDAAAGSAGLIKAAFSVSEGVIAPSLHFKEPNPEIDFENSPFYVPTKAMEWKPENGTPRRAGVNSFGVGGTNAHVILEECPKVGVSSEARPWQFLPLSARTDTALEAMTKNLKDYLETHPDANLADVAFTLQKGRKGFEHRRGVVCRDVAEAVEVLGTKDPSRVATGLYRGTKRSLVFMFSGQGSQYPDMGRELYEEGGVFREVVDECLAILERKEGLDLKSVLFPEAGKLDEAKETIQETEYTQPALFVIEYALARQLMDWGLEPESMIGHSIGEYVAACLSGVFSLEDALSVVRVRGKLMQNQPHGAMLALPLSEEEARKHLREGTWMATINTPNRCVVSGSHDAIAKLQKDLSEQGVDGRLLHTSHAFHSGMMDGMLDAFTSKVAEMELGEPEIPFVSNVTGKWIESEQARDPRYWAKHLREAVRFSEGVSLLLEDRERVFLEVGPGNVLATLAKQHLQRPGERTISSCLRHPNEKIADRATLLGALGRVWTAGVAPDWSKLHEGSVRKKVLLPTYPFERLRFWVDEVSREEADQRRLLSLKNSVAGWFYAPVWKQSVRRWAPLGELRFEQPERWLVFVDDCGLGAEIVALLKGHGQNVTTVTAGPSFGRKGEDGYVIDPEKVEDYDALLQAYGEANKCELPGRMLHLWSLGSSFPEDEWEAEQELSFYSVMHLSRALIKRAGGEPVHLGVVSDRLVKIHGEDTVSPAKATMFGPCRALPQECLASVCKVYDVRLDVDDGISLRSQASQVLADFASGSLDRMVAFRGRERWVRAFEMVETDESKEDEAPARLRERGVYLITGGFGDIGTIVSEYLASKVKAKLVWVGRSEFPARETWDAWIEKHGLRDRVSQRIQRIRAVEERGTQILPLAADVGNGKEMEEVFRKAEEAFGPVNGIIHAAGVLSADVITEISVTSRKVCEEQFHPKIRGTQVLDRLLAGRDLDFCMLVSSLSGVLGGIGLAAYGAGNAYLDAFLETRRGTGGTAWIAVNWDQWKPLGAGSSAGQSDLEKLAIHPVEGQQAFHRLFSSLGEGQLVVSTGNLDARMKKWVDSPFPKKEDLQQEEADETQRHARPALESDFIAPETEVEKQVAAIWQSLLGVKQVGVHDNYFELGGDSLLASQLVARIRKAFQAELQVREFFVKPTVRGVTEMIEAQSKEEKVEPVFDGPKRLAREAYRMKG